MTEEVGETANSESGNFPPDRGWPRWPRHHQREMIHSAEINMEFSVPASYTFHVTRSHRRQLLKMVRMWTWISGYVWPRTDAHLNPIVMKQTSVRPQRNKCTKVNTVSPWQNKSTLRFQRRSDSTSRRSLLHCHLRSLLFNNALQQWLALGHSWANQVRGSCWSTMPLGQFCTNMTEGHTCEAAMACSHRRSTMCYKNGSSGPTVEQQWPSSCGLIIT